MIYATKQRQHLLPCVCVRTTSNNQITLNTEMTLRKHKKKRRKSKTDDKLACCPHNNPLQLLISTRDPLLTSSLAFRSAFASMRACAHGVWPLQAAQMSEIRPHCVALTRVVRQVQENGGSQHAQPRTSTKSRQQINTHTNKPKNTHTQTEEDIHTHTHKQLQKDAHINHISQKSHRHIHARTH